MIVPHRMYAVGGAGLQEQTTYQEASYAHSADGSTLWVYLHIASTLTWAERRFTITQDTAFPRGDRSRLTIGGTGPLAIKLRCRDAAMPMPATKAVHIGLSPRRSAGAATGAFSQ